MAKKLISLLLAGICVTSFIACETQNEGNPVNGNVRVWTAYGTEKIMQDNFYESSATTLEIQSFQNEYESGQIILTPDYNVQEYTIALSDLKSGENTLGKDNFTVYNQKYIEVKEIKDKLLDAPVGFYPDALLPMEKAIEYDENKIVAGENQGIWITLKTPKEQPAGIYTGNFVVTVDGKEKIVPVKVTVYGYAISDESHTKSTYAVWLNEMAQGEQERTVEMEKLYVDYLLDYRMSPQALPTGFSTILNDLDESLEAFLDLAVEYTQNVKCSYFNIPYQTELVNLGSKYGTVININVYEQVLRAMLERSLRENVNLFSKAGNYLLFADEAVYQNLVEEAKYSAINMKALTETLASEYYTKLEAGTLIVKDANFTEEFAREVIEGMRTLKNLLTGHPEEAYQVFDEPVTYVPTIDVYHTEEYRAQLDQIMDEYQEVYNEEGELWTYHCMNPDSPYPTFHIEDRLITSRMLGWTMYHYNIVGSLYWDVTLYAWRKNNSLTNEPLQDYYGTALRFPDANGDGFVVYPGKPYGIEGPVGSIRLQSYRDGMEDYEILYLLENEYKKIFEKNGREYNGKAFEELMELMTVRLYSGTQTKLTDTIDASFQETRALIADLLELTSNTQTMIEEFSMQSSVAKIKLSTDAGNKASVNGKESNGQTYGDRVTYEYTLNLDQEVNWFDLSVQTGSITEKASFYLSGKYNAFDMSEYASAFNLPTGVVGELTAVDAGNFYKVIVPIGDEVRFDVNIADFKINPSSKSIEMSIYNFGEQTTLRILAKGTKNDFYEELDRLTLKSGLNVITYTGLNYAKIKGAFQGLRVYASNASIGFGKIIVEE